MTLSGARLLLAFAALALLPAAMSGGEPADVSAAIAAPGRSDAYRALDAQRRPVEMLAFLGIAKGDHVLDYGAGGGYYSEIIGHAVGPGGSVVGWNTHAFAARENVRTALAAIRQRVPNVSFVATPTTALSFGGGSFDLVLLHLTYHDSYWEDAGFGFARVDPATVTQALFAATRPGGVVGVIDHFAAPGRDARAEVAATHRIDPAVVRADFERAGFVFEAESALLRNPADDRSLRVFNTAIRGRTDRFAFRFRKPGSR